MKKAIPIFIILTLGMLALAGKLSVESIRIKEDKYNAAVSNVCNLALADVWDWEHPGRLSVAPEGYSPTNENARAEFGASVNVGWIIHTNGALEGWREYRITDLQTDFRITLPWANSFKSALSQAGLNVNKDVQIVQEN